MYKNVFDYPCLILYSIAFNLLVYFICVSLLATLLVLLVFLYVVYFNTWCVL